MLDLQFNYANISPIPRYFNLNCGMRREYADDLFFFFLVKTQIQQLLGHVHGFLYQLSGP